MYEEECLVCGETLADEDHDHMADAVVIRDGARGQYLAPTFVLDVDELAPGKIHASIIALAERWLSEMETLSDAGLSTEDYEAVLDASTYAAESALADAGYVNVFDDGYVIYKVVSR